MAKPSNSVMLTSLVAFVIGAVLALVLVPVLARTSAIAAPVGFVAWFRSYDLASLAVFTWNALVVYGLSFGIPAIASLVLLFRLFPGHRIASAIVFSVAVLVSLNYFVPLYLSQPISSPFALAWWQHGLVAALLLAFGVALGISRAIRAR